MGFICLRGRGALLDMIFSVGRHYVLGVRFNNNGSSEKARKHVPGTLTPAVNSLST